MNLTDRTAFVEIVLGFAELRGKQLSAPALELYWRAMQGWSLEDFRAAAERLLRACEWFPLPHHFEQLKRAGRPTAGEAFARAVEHAASSAYRNGPLGDPLVDSAVRAIGGYVVIAQSDEDKLPFLERRFCEHYESIQGAKEVRQELPQIAAVRESIERIAGPKSVAALLARISTEPAEP